MKKFISTLLLVIFSLFLSGYQGVIQDDSESTPEKTKKRPKREGTVLSSIKVEGYVYIELEMDDGTVWLAGPEVDVKKGDRVTTSSMGMEMRNHFSKTLKRTFPVIFFVGNIYVEGAKPDVGKAHAEKPASADAPGKGSIAKADGGYTLEEIFKAGKTFDGKNVIVRAKVVKASGFIMGKNWFHIQDGTGDAKNYDLVVTSDDTAEAGDVVIVTGTLHADKDYGMGYKFDIIIDDAGIEIEKVE